MTLNQYKIENYVMIDSFSETMGKLINRIPGSCLLISSLPGSALRTHVESLYFLSLTLTNLYSLASLYVVQLLFTYRAFSVTKYIRHFRLNYTPCFSLVINVTCVMSGIFN